MNAAKTTTKSRLFLAIFFSFLAVVGSASISFGDFLFAPNPGVARGSAYNAENFADVLGAWSRKNGHVPGTFRSWYLRGSVSDPYWRQLSRADKTYYEIGQKTLAGDRFKHFANLDPVARGRALVAEDGWFRALVIPEGRGWALGLGETLNTGPTPLVRYAAPRLRLGGGLGGAGATRYYFWPWSEDGSE